MPKKGDVVAAEISEVSTDQEAQMLADHPGSMPSVVCVRGEHVNRRPHHVQVLTVIGKVNRSHDDHLVDQRVKVAMIDPMPGMHGA